MQKPININKKKSPRGLAQENNEFSFDEEMLNHSANDLPQGFSLQPLVIEDYSPTDTLGDPQEDEDPEEEDNTGIHAVMEDGGIAQTIASKMVPGLLENHIS
jgi:hypothetical protein